ncbi:MAG: tRNA (N6-isopentenyl adenosine(37)-C2)-methylthiotransferase MiaB [Rickettsiaceae bacterium]|nr:tRNA (N6-isopentenyl adenosine(37)-C2)-methylthiotransferase MiaB [Rickettsiaceae bacterium]
MTKKLFVQTYGCQQNEYDSIRIGELMTTNGYELTNEMKEADMVVLNTCHIREKATQKLYSEIGRIKKVHAGNNKKVLTVVAGCVGQAEGDEIFDRSNHFVDIVVGPQSYTELPKLVDKVNQGERRAIELDFILEAKFDILPESKVAQGASGFVSIQEGCDKFCSFCCVPYTRGAEFSRAMEQVYREALMLASKGSKEIYLLGQNVSAYHGKKPDGSNCDLAELIDLISEIPGVERIRYTTSHPMDMTERLIDMHGMQKKLMPFLHLPVQSGSNAVLKAMNRKYTREKYLELIASYKKARPDIQVSSDFIVGFPGETDEDFDATFSLASEIKFIQSYSFKYSPRPGTPAALKTQIDEAVKVKRLAVLQERLIKNQIEFNETCIGKTMPVLFLKEGRYDNQIIGKTEYMQSVHVDTQEAHNLYGKIIEVKIIRALENSLAGVIE